MTFLLVVAATSAMSVYFRRVIQARIRDARQASLSLARAEGFTGNLYLEYEPYYAVSEAQRVFEGTETRQEFGTQPLGTGIFQMTTDQTTSVQSASNQLPPVNAARDRGWPYYSP